ncbi:hypothetical protein QZH41_019227, partial [Actinostola sp. cb2023]
SSLLDEAQQIATTESSYFNQVLPSEDRSFIFTPQAVRTQTGDTRSSLLPGALTNTLFISGQVKPVSIEPLFQEVDEFKYGDFIRVPLGTNILVNPGFEQPLQSSPLAGWSCQGETDDPRGGALSQYEKEHREGKYSGICYARLAEWAGPGQYIGRKVKSHGIYSFTGWTKLLDPKHTKNVHTLELWLRFKKRGQKKEMSRRLARRDLLSTDDGWVRWKTAFKLPWSPKGFSYVFIFFKGPHKSVDIVADDMKLIEMFQDPNWKRETDVLIEKYRKRHIKIRVNVPPNGLSQQSMRLMEIKGVGLYNIVGVEQKKHKFGFGAAANTDNLIHNEKYRDFFLKNFEWAVLENAMKWPSTEPQKGHFVYDRLDKTLDILERHKFKHWDVNNEMLHGRFFAARLGKPIREWMFKTAAELDPDANLFLNDFDVVENGQLTELLVEQAKELINRGVDIDGIGVQGHFTGPVDPFLLGLHLNALSEVGRPIWLTEVDILNKNVHERADSLEALMRIAFSHPKVNGIILWAFWAKSSWRGPDVALVDANWKLNPAGQRYFQLLDQWTTKGTLNPTKIDKNGAEVRFTAFHGDYHVTVTLPGGNVVKKTFTLETGNSEFTVNIDTGNLLKSSLSLSDFDLVPVDKGFSQLLAKFENELKDLLQGPDLKVDREPNQRLPNYQYKPSPPVIIIIIFTHDHQYHQYKPSPPVIIIIIIFTHDHQYQYKPSPPVIIIIIFTHDHQYQYKPSPPVIIIIIFTHDNQYQSKPSPPVIIIIIFTHDHQYQYKPSPPVIIIIIFTHDHQYHQYKPSPPYHQYKPSPPVIIIIIFTHDHQYQYKPSPPVIIIIIFTHDNQYQSKPSPPVIIIIILTHDHQYHQYKPSPPVIIIIIFTHDHQYQYKPSPPVIIIIIFTHDHQYHQYKPSPPVIIIIIFTHDHQYHQYKPSPPVIIIIIFTNDYQYHQYKPSPPVILIFTHDYQYHQYKPSPPVIIIIITHDHQYQYKPSPPVIIIIIFTHDHQYHQYKPSLSVIIIITTCHHHYHLHSRSSVSPIQTITTCHHHHHLSSSSSPPVIIIITTCHHHHLSTSYLHVQMISLASEIL